jgi:hypothetical protein
MKFTTAAVLVLSLPAVSAFAPAKVAFRTSALSASPATEAKVGAVRDGRDCASVVYSFCGCMK